MNLESPKQQIITTSNISENESLLQDIPDKLSHHLPDINDAFLTQLCMVTSEKSLQQAWNSDDERWNAFL